MFRILPISLERNTLKLKLDKKNYCKPGKPFGGVYELTSSVYL